MASTASADGAGAPSFDAECRLRRSSMASIVYSPAPLHITRSGPQRARAAQGVPCRDAAADEPCAEAALDERLRHVAPAVEAPEAVDGLRPVPRHPRVLLLDGPPIPPHRSPPPTL